MAVLSGKTTSGELAFDKYVKKNSKWKELELEIEKKMEGVFLYNNKKDTLLLESGTSFTLASNSLTTFSSIKYAKVKYNNKVGFIPINRIRKPTKTNVMEAEETAITDLDGLIKDLLKFGPLDICLKINNRIETYKNVSGVRNVTEKVLGREAKSDFCIVDDKNRDLIHISHKKEGGPEAYQQYGGVSEKSGTQQRPRMIYENDEVQQFLRKVTQYIENDRLQNPVYSKIKNDDLINQSVYGPNYNNNYGIDNVHMIGQGNPILKPMRNKENCYSLEFSSHTSYNGDVDFFKKGGYEAVFGATFRAGRGFNVEGKRYKGARIGIYPIALIQNRSGATEI